MAVARVRVGTSGWRYPPWRGTFYPEGLAQRRELEYLSRPVSSIEINGSFYSLQRPESFRAWAAETPEDFVFAVKGGAVHHPPQAAARRRDAGGELPRLRACWRSAPKLGPMLWQLPPRMRFDPERVAAFLELLPRTTSAAAELAAEHDERLDGRALDRDRRRPAAAARRRAAARELPRPGVRGAAARARRRAGASPTRPGTWPCSTSSTAGLRLRPAARRTTSSTRAATRRRRWTDWAAADPRPGAGRRAATSFVYFDNDVKVHAPRDAIALAHRLAARIGVSASERARVGAAASAVGMR